MKVVNTIFANRLMIFELQPLLEKSTKLLTFLRGLRKMDVILHAGKIQNDKCHQVLTQAKKAAI